ncbi:MAG: c-type cytochrome [Gammaproteobacteria bacterium]|nr:c-type cytochrome [Gammaproteobacteria bacterium]
MKKYVISSVALLLGFAATAANAQMGPINGNSEAGAQLYYDHGCYGCHGFSGYGRKDLNNTGSPFLLNEEIFRGFLRARDDVAPLLPSANMPNYPANSLTDAMVKDIYAYVRSMPDNRPDTADIPTLRTILEAAEKRQYKP